MDKNGLAARALKQLAPTFTSDSKITLQEMVLCVGSARDEIIKNKAYALWSTGQSMVWDGVLSRYKNQTLTKEDDCLYYLELPFKTLSLPKNMGIYQVTSSADKRNPIVPVPPTYYTLYAHSFAQSLDGLVGYYQEGNRIYIVGGDVTEDTRIDLLAVVQSEDIAGDAYFPFPPDDENEIIRMAIQQFLVTAQIPEEIRDDNRQDPQ